MTSMRVKMLDTTTIINSEYMISKCLNIKYHKEGKKVSTSDGTETVITSFTSHLLLTFGVRKKKICNRKKKEKKVN
jgi:hypothetical protein